MKHKFIIALSIMVFGGAAVAFSFWSATNIAISAGQPVTRITSITSSPSGWYTGGQLYVSISDSTAGGAALQDCWWSVKDGANGNPEAGTCNPCKQQRSCNSTLQLDVWSGGHCKTQGANQCIVRATSRNRDGTFSTLAWRAFSIDYTKPTTSFVSPPAGSSYASNFTVSLSDSDVGGSGLTCYYSIVDDKNKDGVFDKTREGLPGYVDKIRPCNGSVTVPVGPGGCNTQGTNTCLVRASSRDGAGNLSQLATRSFSIGAAGPGGVKVLPGMVYNFVSGSTNPTEIELGKSFNILCDYGASNIDCVRATSSADPDYYCDFVGFYGTTASFKCDAFTGVGSYTNFCRLASDTASHCSQRADGAGLIRVTPASRPTADISADAVNISYNSSTKIRWTSNNATGCTIYAPSCTLTGSCNKWVEGSAALGGEKSTGNLTSSQSYEIQCVNTFYDPNYIAKDYVTVNVAAQGIGGGACPKLGWDFQNVMEHFYSLTSDPWQRCMARTIALAESGGVWNRYGQTPDERGMFQFQWRTWSGNSHGKAVPDGDICSSPVYGVRIGAPDCADADVKVGESNYPAGTCRDGGREAPDQHIWDPIRQADAFLIYGNKGSWNLWSTYSGARRECADYE